MAGKWKWYEEWLSLNFQNELTKIALLKIQH